MPFRLRSQTVCGVAAAALCATSLVAAYDAPAREVHLAGLEAAGVGPLGIASWDARQGTSENPIVLSDDDTGLETSTEIDAVSYKPPPLEHLPFIEPPDPKIVSTPSVNKTPVLDGSGELDVGILLSQSFTAYSRQSDGTPDPSGVPHSPSTIFTTTCRIENQGKSLSSPELRTTTTNLRTTTQNTHELLSSYAPSNQPKRKAEGEEDAAPKRACPGNIDSLASLVSTSLFEFFDSSNILPHSITPTDFGESYSVYGGKVKPCHTAGGNDSQPEESLLESDNASESNDSIFNVLNSHPNAVTNLNSPIPSQASAGPFNIGDNCALNTSNDCPSIVEHVSDEVIEAGVCANALDADARLRVNSAYGLLNASLGAAVLQHRRGPTSQDRFTGNNGSTIQHSTASYAACHVPLSDAHATALNVLRARQSSMAHNAVNSAANANSINTLNNGATQTSADGIPAWSNRNRFGHYYKMFVMQLQERNIEAFSNKILHSIRANPADGRAVLQAAQQACVRVQSWEGVESLVSLFYGQPIVSSMAADMLLIAIELHWSSGIKPLIDLISEDKHMFPALRAAVQAVFINRCGPCITAMHKAGEEYDWLADLMEEQHKSLGPNPVVFADYNAAHCRNTHIPLWACIPPASGYLLPEKVLRAIEKDEYDGVINSIRSRSQEPHLQRHADQRSGTENANGDYDVHIVRGAIKYAVAQNAHNSLCALVESYSHVYGPMVRTEASDAVQVSLGMLVRGNGSICQRCGESPLAWLLGSKTRGMPNWFEFANTVLERGAKAFRSTGGPLKEAQTLALGQFPDSLALCKGFLCLNSNLAPTPHADQLGNNSDTEPPAFS